MPYEPGRHRRRSIRLPGYDYAQGGAYFVTICVRDRACVLGEMARGEVRTSALGEIVARCWCALPQHFPTVEVDAVVVMPNHLHGILFLTDVPAAGTPPATERRAPLSVVIGAFKSASARQINAMRGTAGAFWQRDYFEHIVRDERGLSRLRTYIEQNPARWDMDRLHPEAPGTW